MELSEKNASILFIHLNKTIEEYADATVKAIIEDKSFNNIVYPPNGGLNDLEKAELVKLSNNEHLKNALRKVIADNSANVIFDMLNLIDGTSDPEIMADEWSGVALVDQEEDADKEPFAAMLHDGLFEKYWEWQDLRGDKNWKLDNL